MARRARRGTVAAAALFFAAASAAAQTAPSYRVPGRPPSYGPYPPAGYPGYPPPGYGAAYPPGYAPPPGYGYPPPGYPPPGYRPGYPPGYGQPPGYAPWAPQYHVAPQVKAGPDPTARYHDSFYLRMTIGPGYLSAKQRFEPSPNTAPPAFPFDNPPKPLPSSLLVAGWTTSFDIMLGGTPAPGIVIGGMFVFNAAPQPNVILGDTTVPSDESFVLWMPAMFIDIFPNPSQGFHFGGIAGIAAVSWERGGTGNNASGFGGGAFVGYDAWVGSQWALGGALRALGATASDTDGSGRAKFTAGSIAIMASALYQ